MTINECEEERTMRIAGTLPCSQVDGYGVRYVILCQRCLHHCVGCQDPELWYLDEGNKINVEELAEDIKKYKHIDGVTLSGGDPFFQQEECVSLLNLLPEHLDIWVYTGFTYEEIKDTQLARMADYIVAGNFEQGRKIIGKTYGSNKRRIIDVKNGGLYYE